MHWICKAPFNLFEAIADGESINKIAEDKMRAFFEKTTHRQPAASNAGEQFQLDKRVIPLFKTCTGGPKNRFFAVLHRATLHDCHSATTQLKPIESRQTIPH